EEVRPAEFRLARAGHDEPRSPGRVEQLTATVGPAGDPRVVVVAVPLARLVVESLRVPVHDLRAEADLFGHAVIELHEALTDGGTAVPDRLRPHVTYAAAQVATDVVLAVACGPLVQARCAGAVVRCSRDERARVLGDANRVLDLGRRTTVLLPVLGQRSAWPQHESEHANGGSKSLHCDWGFSGGRGIGPRRYNIKTPGGRVHPFAGFRSDGRRNGIRRPGHRLRSRRRVRRTRARAGRPPGAHPRARPGLATAPPLRYVSGRTPVCGSPRAPLHAAGPQRHPTPDGGRSDVDVRRVRVAPGRLVAERVRDRPPRGRG